MDNEELKQLMDQSGLTKNMAAAVLNERQNRLHYNSALTESNHNEEMNTLSENLGTPGYTAPQAEIWQDAVAILANQKNLLLKGPTGSGKTKLAETLSFFFGQPIYAVNCSVDLDAEALLGHKTLVQKEGKTVIEFVPGPVIRAMQSGHLLYIDEINMAKPETLPILNSVLDYRRTLVNPFTGETLRANNGFRVIASMNFGYIGTVPLNEALKNRFVVIEIPYLQGEQLKQLLLNQSQQKDETVLDQFVRLSSDLTLQAEMGQVPDDAVSIRALIDACDLSALMPPLRAIERAIIGKLDDERERAAVKNLAETLFEK